MYPSDFPTATEHQYDDMDESGRVVCAICGHRVKIVREGICIGVPMYHQWDDIPDTMATKTTLAKQHGLKLSKDQKPVGAKVQYNHRGKATGGYYPLYAIADATPKKKATQAQLDALEKARHMAEKLILTCSKCKEEQWGRYSPIMVTRKKWIEKDYDHYICFKCNDKADGIAWAKNILSRDDVVILDTETADLYGEIIEIAVIDNKGETLLNQRIKPQGEIAEGAYRVHGISLDDLQECPTFPDVCPVIKRLLQGKLVVIYNAQYDTQCLSSDFMRHEMPKQDSFTLDWNCAMQWYSQYVGDWSDYHRDYRWQKLWGGDHTALGDCLATLEVIREMATPHP